jgi:hypothetical protein
MKQDIKELIERLGFEFDNPRNSNVAYSSELGVTINFIDCETVYHVVGVIFQAGKDLGYTQAQQDIREAIGLS